MLGACRNGGSRGAPSPTPESAIPEGYRGTAWGTSREEIAKRNPDVKPGRKDPTILVRDATIAGKLATEAFFFDDRGLSEVEVRYLPKLTPQESGALGLKMDEMFGAHETTLADEDAYQYAWIGNETEVRLTYDLRDETPFGPVVTYARTAPAPEASPSPSVAASATATAPASKEPGARFGAEVRAARRAGKRLLAVEGAPGKLTLVLGDAAATIEVSLTADPKTGALLGSASLPRAGLESAPKERAEKAIDAELAKGDPIRLTFGGPAGMSDLVTLAWEDDRFVSLNPREKDPLVATTPERITP